MSITRLFDIIFSFVGLIATLPLNIAIALLIIIDSDGFPIYTQTRLGKNGTRFTLYKWRTMRKDAETGKEILSTGGDNRITRFGTILRSTFLDEIPQFYNILKGDMSFVGPRPERPGLSEEFKNIPLWNKRMRVLPGLTGVAQLCGVSSSTPEEKARLDAWLVDNHSTLLYIKISLLTCGMIAKKFIGIKYNSYSVINGNLCKRDV